MYGVGSSLRGWTWRSNFLDMPCPAAAALFGGYLDPSVDLGHDEVHPDEYLLTTTPIKIADTR